MAARLEAEKFTGTNDFGLWRMKMRAMLTQQGLASALDPKPKDSKEKGVLDEKALLKQAEIEAKAHSTIVLCLADKVLREVAKETTAAGILSRLEDLYLTKSLANRLYMKRRLYSYRFLENKGVLEQLEEFNKSIDDLENIDAAIGDEDKAILLLNALPRSFDQLRDALLYGRDKAISFVEVQNAVRAKELHKEGIGNEVISSVAESLNVKKHKFKKPFKKDYESSKTAQSSGVEKRSCHWCKKPGHLKRDCFAWKKKQAQSGEKLVNATDSLSNDGDDQILNVMENGVGGSWIMDSGCSFHMSSNLRWFLDLSESTGSVILGNNQVCQVEGIGSVRLRMNDGCTRILTDVRYIPQVKRNLISLGLLERKGCMFASCDGKMVVSKNGKKVMEAERRGSLYYLLAEVQTPMAEVNSVTEDAKIWHMRLGHPAEGTMKELVRKGAVQANFDKQQLKCEECVLGKSKKLAFPKGKHLSTQPLDYAHSDLWGPAQVNSIGGGKYYMTIIDDYSRKIWIYILKEKSEAFKKFSHWCCEVELEKGIKLKCLRTDNGMEYLSREFDDYCKTKGIKRHRTVPMNPQQNGVAERANRTIVERVRCLLLSAGLERRFWAEAASTAVKLLNMCPASSIEGDIPDYRWHGSLGDYSRLKIFGCQAYAHVRQGKLEARALRCIMIGYQSGVKGYRLWCIEPGNARIIISRDVIFWESEMPFLKSKSKTDQKPENVDLEVEPVGVLPEFAKDDRDQDATADSEAPTIDSDSLRNYQLARDRVRRRNVEPPARFSDSEMLFYALCVAEEVEYNEPATYREAVQSKEADKWMLAMVEEIESLMKNGTWILVERVEDRKVVSCKWIFKKKIESGVEGDHIRFKARLVARGFTQEQGVDFTEVFSPVVKHTSIRILIAVVAKKNWEMEQLDVKTAFLHGELEETIYMAQPEGFVNPGDESKVCLLKRSIYGLKQASRQWHKRFDDHMVGCGFIKSLYDECVYIKKRNGVPVAYLLLYVDDMLLAGECMSEIQSVKDDLAAAFDMKDLGPAKRILGMNILRDRERRLIRLSQHDYVSRILRKFKMDNIKEAATPLAQQFKLSMEQIPKSEAEMSEMQRIPFANMVGSIMYAMISTRPDVAHSISVISRYMANHGREHWRALKWLMRYLKGAGDSGIVFRGDDEYRGDVIIGYCDSDFAGNIDNRRSQTGYLFTMFGAAISWKSSLQSVVALSTTEAEFMALTAAVKESYWLKGIAADFGYVQPAISIGCDNSSAICLAKHKVYHERSKHIDVRLHFIREGIERGEVKVFKVHTDDNPADMLTKPLHKDKFEKCKALVSVCKVKED